MAAFKLNFAFFEALGPDGWSVLERVRLSVPSEVPVIADAKRADIPNTSRFYARAVFDSLNCDAVTLNPYLGWESIEPFLEWKGKGALILTRTSNPGAADPQELTVNGEPLYLHVARRALLQGGPQVGLVVGATEPEAVRRVRGLDPDAILLLVGVGAQGASLADAMSAGAGRDGENALIGMSRHILYASRGRDFAEAARQATEEANSRMQTSR